MPKRKLTEIERENFQILKIAIGKMVSLMHSESADAADYRKLVNVLYSSSRAIGSPIQEDVGELVDALLEMIKTPDPDHLKVMTGALAHLNEDLEEL